MGKQNIERRQIVVANELIVSSYKMGLSEKRILMCVLSQIGVDDTPTDDETYTLTVRDYQRATGLGRSAAWEELRDGADRLVEKVIRINSDTEKYKRTIIVQECDYDPSLGVVMRFGRAIIPYISQLKKEFTKYRLMDAVSFGSIYTIRIYEMLMSFQSVGSCVLMVDDLRFQLELGDKYKNGKDFRKNIIERPISEINSAGKWIVSAKPEKIGRKIAAYTFDFREVKNEIQEGKNANKSKAKTKKPATIPRRFIETHGDLAPPGASWDEVYAKPPAVLRAAWEACEDWVGFLG